MQSTKVLPLHYLQSLTVASLLSPFPSCLTTTMDSSLYYSQQTTKFVVSLLFCVLVSSKDEEGDAPWQLVLGSMDTSFCVSTSLASWMELNHRENPNAALSPYLFIFTDDVSIPNGVQKSKETGAICLQNH